MRRRGAAGVLAVGLWLFADDARAGERWALDPERSGEWVAVEEPDAVVDVERDPPDEARSEEPAPRRSGGAIAGGVVLTSFGALTAGLGGFMLLFSVAAQRDDEEIAAAGAVTALGLGATAGGITLIVWGAQREPEAAVVVAPTSVHLRGSF